MGNPFAPLSYKLPPSEPRAPDHPPMGRLRRLGLKREEEALVYEVWKAMSGKERFEAIEALSHIGDDELREQIKEGRAERASLVGDLAEATIEQYTDALDLLAPEDGLLVVDPEEAPDGTVADVLAWVDGDQGRARAAMVAEQRRHDPPRKTLTGPLEDILG